MRNVLLLAVVLFATAVWADESRIPLVRPIGSPLQLTKLNMSHEHFAEFRGEVVVSGTLYAYWHSSGSLPVEFRLIPDKTSADRLPHFAKYKVSWIEIKNGASALEMSLSKHDFRVVMAKQGPIAQVTGTWEIADYAVGVECDGPYAYAKVLRVVPAGQVASVKAPETC